MDKVIDPTCPHFSDIQRDVTLNWDIHLQSLAHQLNKVSFMIKTLKETLSPYMIRHIYFTKFQAILRSGILLWGGNKRGLEYKSI
jgi:hypothetical protein